MGWREGGVCEIVADRGDHMPELMATMAAMLVHMAIVSCALHVGGEGSWFMGRWVCKDDAFWAVLKLDFTSRKREMTVNTCHLSKQKSRNHAALSLLNLSRLQNDRLSTLSTCQIFISLIYHLYMEFILAENGALSFQLAYFYEAHSSVFSSIFSSECVLECTDNVGLGSIIVS